MANPEFGALGETHTGRVSVHHTPVLCTGSVHWSGLIGSKSPSLNSTRAFGDPFCSHGIVRKCKKNSDWSGFEELDQRTRVAFLIAEPDSTQGPQSLRRGPGGIQGAEGLDLSCG